MRTKLLSLSLLALSGYSIAGGPGGPGLGGPPFKAPVDTNEVILIIAAVLLTVGAVAYRKLSLKKA